MAHHGPATGFPQLRDPYRPLTREQLEETRELAMANNRRLERGIRLICLLFWGFVSGCMWVALGRLLGKLFAQ